jgi:hypothetical protein
VAPRLRRGWTHHIGQIDGTNALASGAYGHDALGRLIGENNAAGTIQREYLWLDTTPIAVIE